MGGIRFAAHRGKKRKNPTLFDTKNERLQIAITLLKLRIFAPHTLSKEYYKNTGIPQSVTSNVLIDFYAQIGRCWTTKNESFDIQALNNKAFQYYKIRIKWDNKA